MLVNQLISNRSHGTLSYQELKLFTKTAFYCIYKFCTDYITSIKSFKT